MHLDNIQVPGFFWVLFISLLSATTYRIEYGVVVFYVMLFSFGAVKFYQVARRESEIKKYDTFRETAVADREFARKKERLLRFFMG